MQPEYPDELRRNLGRNVAAVKGRGRISRNAFAAGVALVIMGYVMIAIATSLQFAVLSFAGLGIVHLGSGFALVGVFGILLFRVFGYVWIREELHDAAMIELCRQARSDPRRG